MDWRLQKIAVGERPEIHIIQAYPDARAIPVVQGNSRDNTLAMNTLRTETMVGRQLHFNGYNLPGTRGGNRPGFASPCHQQAAAANVFNVHRAARPQNRRGDKAPQLDFYPMVLAPVDVFHLILFDT
jgi:hypothetical protein